MFQRTGIGGDAAGRNGTASQCPQKAFIPVRLAFGIRFGFRQRLGNPTIGIVDGLIDRHAVFGFQSVFFIPDIQRGRLQRKRIVVRGLNAGGNGFQSGCTHIQLISMIIQALQPSPVTPHYILGFLVIKTQHLVFQTPTLTVLKRPVNTKF